MDAFQFSLIELAFHYPNPQRKQLTRKVGLRYRLVDEGLYQIQRCFAVNRLAEGFNLQLDQALNFITNLNGVS